MLVCRIESLADVVDDIVISRVYFDNRDCYSG